jgi:hypothetical protein
MPSETNLLFAFQDHYKTLSPEPESLTPLFSAGDEQRIPRLDSFITTPPAESPTPPLSSKYSSKESGVRNSSQAAQAIKLPPKKETKDPFDDFDFPASGIFDSTFNLKRPGFTYTTVPLATTDSSNGAFLASNLRHEIEDDAISFPSLPDPSLAASSALKAATRGESLLENNPPPPTPPSEVSTLAYPQTQPSLLLAQPPLEKSLVKKEASAKKKKKKRSKSKKTSSKAEDEDNDNDMAHAQRPEDTPQPSSESGMRFDELYRLRGVVSTKLGLVSLSC